MVLSMVEGVGLLSSELPVSASPLEMLATSLSPSRVFEGIQLLDFSTVCNVVRVFISDSLCYPYELGKGVSNSTGS
jgi:hypothetical protein